MPKMESEIKPGLFTPLPVPLFRHRKQACMAETLKEHSLMPSPQGMMDQIYILSSVLSNTSHLFATGENTSHIILNEA